jgi:hypothetical protein
VGVQKCLIKPDDDATSRRNAKEVSKSSLKENSSHFLNFIQNNKFNVHNYHIFAMAS